jgi:hypothetical protein
MGAVDRQWVWVTPRQEMPDPEDRLPGRDAGDPVSCPSL